MKASLLIAAVEALQDDLAGPSLWGSAAVGLSTAVDEGLVVPARAAELLLQRLFVVSARHQYVVTEALGKLPDRAVREKALDLLQDPGTGDQQFELLIDIVCGPAHRAHVSESVLLGLCDRNNTARKVDLLSGLVEAMCEVATLSREALLMIRDKWALAEGTKIRERAVVVGRYLPADAEFIRQMLNDSSPKVRRWMADELGFFTAEGNDAILDVLAERLFREEDPETLSSLWAAQASLQHQR